MDISIKKGNAKEQMHSLANEIVFALKQADPEHSQELLSTLVSELFLAATTQSIQENRRQKQAEGIAKAKAKGVHFGPCVKPLPENFEEAHRSWRNQEMTLRDAAKLCGMPRSSFHDAVKRVENAESRD